VLSVKFAIATTSQRTHDLVYACFHEGDHEVVRYGDDQALIRAIARDSFSAILIDITDSGSLRDSRAIFASRDCQSQYQAPLILLGHFADRASLDRAFAAGADDLVRLPIDADELYVRTMRAVRRNQTNSVTAETLNVAAYCLDKRMGVVQFADQTVQLTPREFAIAWMLFSRSGQYLSRQQISVAVWGCNEEVAGRTLEQHIYKLRKKLVLNGSHGARLGTQYAHGYRIESQEVTETPPTKGSATEIVLGDILF
jgi:DNA-binding response OmpR family regulator